jgi:hypothetical protein
MRVLILGGRAPVALDHARRFAAHGWTAYIADSVSCRISGWSRAVAQTFRLPYPRDALAAFATSLADIITHQRIDLVLPTCEEIFYLSRIRHRLPAFCNVFTAPFDQLGQLHSKWSFLGLAREAGFAVPDSIRVSNLEQAGEWAGQRPIVMKPEFSRFGVHVRIYRQGIPKRPAPLPPHGPWVAQLFEPGREICSYSIAVRGRLHAHVAYVPTYRLRGSSSYYFEPLRIDSIESQVERFVARIGFTGQISFDWIERATGDFVALECNPRAISGLHLFGLSQPLPAAIISDETARVLADSSAPRMLAPVMLTAGLQNASRSGTVRRWQHDWARATDVLSAPGDARPAFGAIRDILALTRLSMRHRCSVRAAATRDIEWDGQPLVES